MRLRTFAMIATVWVGCAPPSAPSTPPAELTLPPPMPVVIDEGPALPAVLPPPAAPRGPGELLLPVADERNVADLGAYAAGDVPTVTLTLKPCSFSPAENATIDTGDADHCRRANHTTFDARGQTAIVLSPGIWDIAVTNDAFDRPLGLWLRAEDDPATPIISAGGVDPDATRTWRVVLPEGRYIYSCPLSPTPDYLLIVR